MRLIAILSLATILMATAGCSASPTPALTENPGEAPGSPPAPSSSGDILDLILQTPVAQRLEEPGGLAIVTMEEAREALPFPIETPEYLPEGFAVERGVLVTLQRLRGGPPTPDNPIRPSGVMFRYVPVNPTAGDRQRFITVEQSLLLGKPKVVMNGEKKVVQLGNRPADLWHTTNLSGNPFILVAWDETQHGTATLVTSTEGEQETLEVARSFR